MRVLQLVLLIEECLGKVRHIEVCQLWLQDKVRKGDIKITKVGTNENLADALTKFVSREGIDIHMKGTGQVITHGRHELAPKVEG